MKAKVIVQGSSFVGTVVSCNLENKRRNIDLSQVDKARLGTRRVESYIHFKDDTHLMVSRAGILGKRIFIRGSITLRVSALSEDIRFDIQKVDDSYIPAEEAQFILPVKSQESL